MTIAHQALCIGGTACSTIFPKKYYTHARGILV
jgi:ferredoxin